MNAPIQDKSGAPISRDMGSSVWVSRSEIMQISGALKPAAYVARAYLYLKETGESPAWAQKTAGGRWLFDRNYVEHDAVLNISTIGISEAAEHAGTSRRTIQTWVDEGILKTASGEREPGQCRHVDRQAFLKALPKLRARLDGGPASTPSVLPERFDEGALSSGERRSLARLRQRLSTARTKREAVLREAQSADRAVTSHKNASGRLVTKMTKVRHHFSARLKSLEKALAYAENKQNAEGLRAQRLLSKAEDMQAHELEIERQLALHLSSAKKAQAEALAQQLEAARRPRPAKSGQTGERVARVRSLVQEIPDPSADADSLLADSEQYAAAVEIAESLAEDIEAGHLDPIDGAIRFNDLAELRHIPKDVRIALTREFFSQR